MLGKTPVPQKSDEPQTAESQAMIDRLTDWIQTRGLAGPAILFLEASKPLALIGSQMLLVLQPMLGAIGPAWFADHRVVAEYAALLEDPVTIDRLLVHLERAAE